MNEPNVVNREVILEQVADKGLFVICIRSGHLFTESFASVFYLIIRHLATTSASPSRVPNFQDGVALLFCTFIPWFSTSQEHYFEGFWRMTSKMNAKIKVKTVRIFASNSLSTL